MTSDKCLLIQTLFKKHGIKFQNDISLKKISYFKTGGLIHFFLTPNNKDELCHLVKRLTTNQLAYRILGATSNSVFLDQTDIDIGISLKNFKDIQFDTTQDCVTVGAGVQLPALIKRFKKSSIQGFEGLEGIPATIGGAVYMNAGSYGYEISDHLLSVDVIDPEGNTITLKKEECHFSYRKSIFHTIHNDKMIVSVKLKTVLGDSNQIEQKIDFFYHHRHSTLEYKNPNVGSVFVTHDIYKELAKHSFFYRIILGITRHCIHRIFRIKTNRLLNKITFKYFGLEEYLDIVSPMTMNVIINSKKPTYKIVRYIESVKRILGNSIRQEIEIL